MEEIVRKTHFEKFNIFQNHDTNNVFDYDYIFAYLCLYTGEINNSNDTRSGRKELGLFCYISCNVK